ncbi:contactin-4-like [Mya arenaria]|uniref:contactin-4-like n=1 Tax=Mya arenaria TaxID=6604 RepID=UPI0022E16670|nr:contactin-4-like [Mya arenaria]
MTVYLLFFYLLCVIPVAYGQAVYGCPLGWAQYSGNCYQFNFLEQRAFLEADAACWSQGAKLVSIETADENHFLSTWIRQNSPSSINYWYTSGMHMNGILLWEAINSIHSGVSMWINDRAPPFQNTVYRVVLIKNRDNVYKWTNVTASHPGSYICEVQLENAPNSNLQDRDFTYGMGRTDIRTIHKGPVIIKQPTNIVMFPDVDNVQFECLVEANPLPSYQYYGGDTLSFDNNTLITSAVSSRYTLTAGKLTIEKPDQTEDNTYYHVRVSNEKGTVLSTPAQLIFGHLGFFSNVKPDSVFADLFKGTQIACNPPSYSPMVTYSWFINAIGDIPVWDNMQNQFVSQTGKLFISSVQPTEVNRDYFCTVTLTGTDDAPLGNANMIARTSLAYRLASQGSGVSDNDYGPILYTNVMPSPTLTGNTVRMECIAYGKLPLEYSWYREDGRPFSLGTTLSDRNRVLTIRNTPIDAEGRYVCRCVGGSKTVKKTVITLSLDSKPYFPFGINNQFADPGMTLSWFCKAVGKPKPTYSWYRNGILLQPQSGRIEILDSGMRLVIRDVDSPDEGMYQCGATNYYGTVFSSGELKVLSLTPNFDRSPMPAVSYAALNGNKTIACGVEAAPLPQVKWLKNGGDLGLSPSVDQFNRIWMDAAYTLHINGVAAADAGTYTCSATNINGDANNHTRLVVTEGAKITPSKREVYVTVNRTAFIGCQANVDVTYDVAYIWKFNGHLINFNVSKEYLLGNQQSMNGLYIISAKFWNEGEYECVVTTPLNTVSAATSLIVSGPPGPPAGAYAETGTITTRSAVIVWTVTAGMEHHSDIIAFDIEAASQYHPDAWKVVAQDIVRGMAVKLAADIGKRADQCAYNVSGLIPFTNYRFRVRAVNVFGRGQEASEPSANVHMNSMRPVVPPSYVRGGGGTVGVLTIRWQPIDIAEQCGPGFGYNIYWKTKGDNRDWRHDNRSDAVTVNQGVYVTIVGLENYYLPYMVKIGAFNILGSGPNSTEVQIYSAEAMPQIVPLSGDAQTHNSTSIIAYWTPVPDTREAVGGKVAGYRVYYYANLYGDTPFDQSEPDPIINDILYKDVYGQTDHVQLVGLEPNAEFFTRVQVFNGAGFGPKGEWRRSETANMFLRNFPIHVKVDQNGPYSIYVTWQGVVENYDECSVEGYLVRVWKIQEDVRTAVDTKTYMEEHAIVSGLQQNTVYSLRVLGWSAAGDGAISEARYFMLTNFTYHVSIAIDPSISEMCYSNYHTRTCGGQSVLLNPLTFIPVLVITLMTLFELIKNNLH